MSATKTQSPAPRRSAAAKSKVTPAPTTTAKTALVAAPKAPGSAKVDLETLLKFAPKAKDAAHLAKLAGVADDLAFRRAVTHHAQGSRVLSQYRATLVREDDPKRYVEPRPTRKQSSASDASALLTGGVKVAESRNVEA